MSFDLASPTQAVMPLSEWESTPARVARSGLRPPDQRLRVLAEAQRGERSVLRLHPFDIVPWDDVPRPPEAG